jgi:lipoprotein-anchoring transpeptidase ErfK/SrfK
MSTRISRRDFLKISALALGSMAFRPFGKGFTSGQTESGDLARIAINSVSVYIQPNDKSRIVYQRYRDELVNIYYEVVSEYGPGYNPVWYRVWGGFIHSAHLVRVKYKINPVVTYLPYKKNIVEVTVPMSQTFRYSKPKGWEPLYRLYYESVHWVVGVEEGPDGEPWYRIKDELFDIDQLDYFTPAQNLRLVTEDEISPISPNVPPEKKWIEVSLPRQMLTAYEYDNIVLQTKISSGLSMSYKPPPGEPRTNTPRGDFHIQNKMPSKHMGNGDLTAQLDAYELPGVPWVCFFEPKTGVATHGTYWHTNYGTPMSHGCVNMRSEDAKFIFRWATPYYKFGEWDTIGYGTYIKVI